MLTTSIAIVNIANIAIEETCDRKSLNKTQVEQLFKALAETLNNHIELIAAMRPEDIMGNTPSEHAKEQIRRKIKKYLTNNEKFDDIITTVCMKYIGLYTRREIAKKRYENPEIWENASHVLNVVMADNEKTRKAKESSRKHHARHKKMLLHMLMQTAHYPEPEKIDIPTYIEAANKAIQAEYR